MDDKFNNELYAGIPLKGLRSGEELIADVFLKINDKYIKYKEMGDEITGEKLDFFISKNLSEIFVRKEKEQEFNDWISETKIESINRLVEEVGEEHRELVEKREELREIIYETFSDQELDSAAIEVLQHQAKGFVLAASQEKINMTIIAKLNNFNQSVADHSVNTANLAVYIAMCCGFGSQYDLENIYLGGLLHDYGKAKIPANVLENKGNVVYSQAIQDHPIKGVKLIKRMKNIPEEVQMIVGQHHEQNDGNGYPKGLKGDAIYKFSMIVALANVFNNIVEEELKKRATKKPNVDMYRRAIKVLEYDNGKQFNTEYMERTLDGLKLAFGNYKK